jgi:hypothetical protein
MKAQSTKQDRPVTSSTNKNWAGCGRDEICRFERGAE